MTREGPGMTPAPAKISAHHGTSTHNYCGPRRPGVSEESPDASLKSVSSGTRIGTFGCPFCGHRAHTRLAVRRPRAPGRAPPRLPRGDPSGPATRPTHPPTGPPGDERDPGPDPRPLRQAGRAVRQDRTLLTGPLPEVVWDYCPRVRAAMAARQRGGRRNRPSGYGPRAVALGRALRYSPSEVRRWAEDPNREEGA